MKLVLNRLFLSFLTGVFLSVCVPEVMASTAGSAPTGVTQNDLGDVIGPGSSAGFAGTPTGATITTPSSFYVPDAAALTALSTSSTASGLSGCSSSDITTLVTFMGSLNSNLQSTFTNMLFSAATCSISSLIADFTALQTMLGTVQNFACGGGISMTENLVYAQNSISLSINIGNVSSILGGSSSFMNSAMSSVCGSLGSLPIPGGGSTDTLSSPVSGPVSVMDSDCSSSWQSARSSRPSTMDNPVLLNEIKRASIELGMDPNQLAGVIWLESRGDPTLANFAGCPNASAIGLIQFIRATAVELGMHNQSTCSGHQSVVGSMSISEQMDYVIRYYKGRGWEAGMSDYQAYATVHHGNPYGSSNDGITGQSTDSIFNNSVLPKMEAFRCGGFDWNTLTWVPGA